MKKYRYFLIGLIFLSLIAFNLNVRAQYPTYQVGVKKDSELIWEVITVDSIGLEEVLGSNYTAKGNTQFGVGWNQLGAKTKWEVENILTNTSIDYGIGIMYSFQIYTKQWPWTTTGFESVTPVSKSYYTFYDPQDVQALSANNGRNVSIFDFWMGGIASIISHFYFLPIPANDYLAELIWSSGHTISDFTLTVENAIPPLDPTWFLTNYTINYTFDSDSGAFIGYRLQDNESSVIYEIEADYNVPSEEPEISGYSFPFLIGITSLAMVCLLYIIMRKK
ncbi:MAG: hypothetical protein ACFE9T_06540 [Promethearchaeota archaeon]